MEDAYDIDTCNFRVLGYDVEVKDALIAEAFCDGSDRTVK